MTSSLFSVKGSVVYRLEQSSAGALAGSRASLYDSDPDALDRHHSLSSACTNSTGAAIG